MPPSTFSTSRFLWSSAQANASRDETVPQPEPNPNPALIRSRRIARGRPLFSHRDPITFGKIRQRPEYFGASGLFELFRNVSPVD